VILLTVKFAVVAIRFVETLMFFTLSVARVLLKVKFAFAPKTPASLNWTSVVNPETAVVLIEPRVFEELL
jgi:hypothetical protein